MKNLIISADDYGLTESVTDSILEAVDQGVVNSVSILANGEAVKYALQEYEKRKDRLSLSVHLNLTEGLALSSSDRIPHLVNTSGRFIHTPFSLFRRYIFSSRKERSELSSEIALELKAQWKHIRDTVPVEAADSHQHIHMLPFVFDQ